MAGRGPAPKPAGERRRRNKTDDFEELPAEGFTGKYPALPKTWRTEQLVITEDADGNKTTEIKVVQVTFLKATRDWYVEWAHSPMATKFTPVDWSRLRRIIAPLADQYHRSPSVKLAAELRLQEEKLGATVMDRQRLRMNIAAAPAAPQTGTRRAAAAGGGRRARLSVVK